MFAVGGMMLFPASGDLLTMFVALEVLSLPLYLLCGLARRRRLLSQEAAMKYFVLGAFSSGFFLYGVALVYGYAGSMELATSRGHPQRRLQPDAAARRRRHARRRHALQGRRRAVPGLDARRLPGRPTAVTAFMAAATKVAAFGAMLRLFYVAFGSDRSSWQPMIWVIAILTMVVGAVLPRPRRDMKRMLAYSSVAHTGFLLTGVIGAPERPSATASSPRCRPCSSTSSPTASPSAPSRSSRWSATPAASSSIALGRLGKHSPLVAGVFALPAGAWPASR